MSKAKIELPESELYYDTKSFFEEHPELADFVQTVTSLGDDTDPLTVFKVMYHVHLANYQGKPTAWAKQNRLPDNFRLCRLINEVADYQDIFTDRYLTRLDTKYFENKVTLLGNAYGYDISAKEELDKVHDYNVNNAIDFGKLYEDAYTKLLGYLDGPFAPEHQDKKHK